MDKMVGDPGIEPSINIKHVFIASKSTSYRWIDVEACVLCIENARKCIEIFQRLWVLDRVGLG